MGMFDTFETDKKREVEGVYLDYGDFRVLIAHAGQGNKKYVAYAEKAMRPVRQAMNAGSLSNERSMSVMIDIYVKTIILGWEVLKKGEDGKADTWVSGIESREGGILPFSEDNVSDALKMLPALFVDLQQQATSIANFRRAGMDEDAGN